MSSERGKRLYTLFPQLPWEAGRDLDRRLARANLLRCRLAAWLLVIALVASLAWEAWSHNLMPAAASWIMFYRLTIRLGLIVVCVVYLLLAPRSIAESDISLRHRVLLWSFLLALLGGAAHLAGVNLAAAGPSTYYLLAILAGSAFLYLDGVRSLAVYSAAMVCLLLAVWWSGLDWSRAVNPLLEGTVICLLGLIISRVIYLTEVRRFLDQRLIRLQKSELERSNRRLAESNRMLERLSFLDGLTGVPNRRYFDEFLAREWRRSVREGLPITLLMADIDHFKKFNDRYGHQAGDECLTRVARVLQDCLQRPGDLAARYGGEEFALVLPQTDEAGAARVARRVRREVRALGIPHQDWTPGMVTISLGAATLRPGGDQGMEELVRASDQALYLAKSRGRDRWVAAGENAAPDD